MKTDGARTRYMERDYGCEGIFIELQSDLLGVEVISLTKGALAYEKADHTIWLVPPDSFRMSDDLDRRIRIIGKPLEASVHWAMDGFAAPNEPMKWPLEPVIHVVGLASRQVGVAGQAERNGVGGTVFVPVAILREPTAAFPDTASIELIVRVPTGRDLCWQLKRSDPCEKATKIDEADGYYKITLPDFGVDGEVQLLVRWRHLNDAVPGEPERLSIYLW